MKTQSVKQLEKQHDKVSLLDMPEADKLDTLEGIEGEMVEAEYNEKRLTELTTLQGWDQALIFTDEKILDELLNAIDDAARNILWDSGTKEGRAIGVSIARKVSSSKVIADNAGKALTDDWVKKKAAVDAGRRKLREFCDALRDEIKAPVEAWKEEEARKERVAKLAEEFAVDHAEALDRNDLYDREAVVKKAEDAIAANQLLIDEKALVERREADYKLREENAAAEAVETERKLVLDEDARIRLEDAARAKDKEHRRKINREVVIALTAAGADSETAITIVTAIATGMVPHVKIQY